jgi:hypothetical protein
MADRSGELTMAMFSAFLKNEKREHPPANSANPANFKQGNTGNSQLSQLSQGLPEKTENASPQGFATFATGEVPCEFCESCEFDGGPDAPPEPDDVELEYRAGMAMDSVPEADLDATARLQLERPAGMDEHRWRLAINDAGLFLDQWASLAIEFRWTVGDLFDVPRDGKLGGLVWFLNGDSVRSLGPEHAVTESGRVFDRSMR